MTTETRIRQWAVASDRLASAKARAFGPGGSGHEQFIEDTAERRAVRYWALRRFVAEEALRGVVGMGSGFARRMR